MREEVSGLGMSGGRERKENLRGIRLMEGPLDFQVTVSNMQMVFYNMYSRDFTDDHRRLKIFISTE